MPIILKELNRSHPGSSHPNWKGGRRQMVNGYVEVYSPSHPNKNARNCIYEHRAIMEKIIGRLLNKGEQVHHKNKIKNDNRPENLELLNTREHLVKYHRVGKDNPNYKDGRSLNKIRLFTGRGNGKRSILNGRFERMK